MTMPDFVYLCRKFDTLMTNENRDIEARGGNRNRSYRMIGVSDKSFSNGKRQTEESEKCDMTLSVLKTRHLSNPTLAVWGDVRDATAACGRYATA